MSETTNPISAIKRTILRQLPLPQLPGWESRLVMLEYPPGTSAPLHTHPIAGICYVVEGEVISQFEGGSVERCCAGETFVDLKQELHVRAENASSTAGLKVLASYVVEVGQPNMVLHARA